MTKIDGLEIVITKQIKGAVDKEITKRFDELKPEIVNRYEQLLNMRNMETDQFNNGFEAARSGKLESDHPHYDLDTDNWRLGYAWGAFEQMKQRIAELENDMPLQKACEEIERLKATIDAALDYIGAISILPPSTKAGEALVKLNTALEKVNLKRSNT